MTRKNFILSLMVAALAAYIYIFEIKKPREEAENQNFQKLVIHLEKDSVQKIRLQNTYNEFAFEKKDKVWYITAPVADIADARAVDEMLNFFKRESWIQEVPIQGAQDLQKYGIGVNRSTWVELEDQMGTKDKVLVSNSKTLEGGTYLYWEEEKGKALQQKVYTASKGWSDFFEKNVLYFRDKTVLRQDLNYVQKVEIRAFGQDAFQFFEGKDNWRYQIANEKEIKIENRKVFDWIQDLVDWSSLDFLDKKEFYATRRQALGIPDASRWMKVRLSDLAGKNHLQFMVSPIINHKAYVDVEGRDQVLEVFENTIDFLQWRLVDFQDPKKAFKLEFTDLQKIVWKDGGKTLTLTPQQQESWVSFWRMFLSLKAHTYEPQEVAGSQTMDLRFYDASNQELWALLAYKIDTDSVHLKIVKGKESFFVELLKKDWDNFYKVLQVSLQR